MTSSSIRYLSLTLLIVLTAVAPTPAAADGARQETPRVPWEPEWGAIETPETFSLKLEAAHLERRTRIDEERRLPIRAIYLPAARTGDAARVQSVIDMIESTELNAVVIDVKCDYGNTIHPSSVPLAAAASGPPRVRDLGAFFRQFTDRGIKVIARIVVFKDTRVLEHKPEWGILSASGTPWRDGIGSGWTDPYNPDMWDYVIDISAEAALAGAWEIQFDYVRFPSDGRGVGSLHYPFRDERRFRHVIRDFLAHAYERLEPFEVVIGADVFALTATSPECEGIGQQWDKLAEVVDVLSPMAYPSHYGPGIFDIPDPDAEPYRTVLRTMQDGTRRAGIDTVTIRPWLQDFSWRHTYGPDQVRAQIQAVYDSGSTGWMLWNSGGRVTLGALLSADHTP